MEDENEIKVLLDKLAEAKAHRDVIAQPYLAQIAALEQQMAAETDSVDFEIAVLEERVKGLVAQHGASVKGERLHAVYSVRHCWDTNGLLGFALTVPAIRAFHSVSTSVSIRNVK